MIFVNYKNMASCESHRTQSNSPRNGQFYLCCGWEQAVKQKLVGPRIHLSSKKNGVNSWSWKEDLSRTGSSLAAPGWHTCSILPGQSKLSFTDKALLLSNKNKTRKQDTAEKCVRVCSGGILLYDFIPRKGFVDLDHHTMLKNTFLDLEFKM